MDNYQQIFNMRGKTALVTGATGILGREFCRALAEFDADVIVADRDQSSCEQFAEELSQSFGIKAYAFAVDLAHEADIVRWAQAILESHQIDILINNAAAKAEGFFSPLAEYASNTWNSVMAVNVNAPFLTMREIGTRMANRKSGSIINICSIYGVVGPDQRIYEGSFYPDLGGAINTPMVYSASKGALLAMTRYAATYWGESGVRVNAITPGGVASGQNNEFSRRYSEKVPLGRMAERSEMVGAVIYLSSDASSYVTGHNLIVDGGWTAW